MGIQPCYSGLQVKGTAAPPPSTHLDFCRKSLSRFPVAYLLSGERGIRTLETDFMVRLHDFQSCAFNQLSHLSE